MTGREGEERAVGQDGQTERNGAEDQRWRIQRQLHSEKKTVEKISKTEREEKNKTSNIIKDTNILKARVGGARVGKAGRGQRGRIRGIAATFPSKVQCLER